MTNTKAAVSAACVDGDGGMQDKVNEGENQTGADNGEIVIRVQ